MGEAMRDLGELLGLTVLLLGTATTIILYHIGIHG